MIPNNLFKYLLVLGLILAQLSYAENPPEGLDFIGGYFEGGVYKCYAEPCFSLHKNKYPSANKIEFQPLAWPHWLDIDRNCQKENLQAIVDASLIEVTHQDNDPCAEVLSGKWEGAYSGQLIESGKNVVADWLVSLREAHALGGFAWKRNKRALFANLPENLIVVSKAERQARDGRPAHEWMPSNKRYWCDYVVGRELVFRKFDLEISEVESEFNQEVKRLYCKF